VIRDEMEQTRANLADKLGALETQVRETVVGAKEAVSSTVEGVKEVVGSVSETMGTVAETFDVTKQVDRHPWAAMGVAVAAGFVAAQLFDRLGHPAPAPGAPGRADSLSDLPLTTTRRFPETTPAAQPKNEGLLGSMMPDLNGVMNTMLSNLGGLAVNSLFGVIRELASRELPQEWKGEVSKLVDQVASQLGGRPIDESRSSQLLDALGLGAKKEEETAQQQQHDQARQPVGVGNGPQQQGVRARDGRYTNL